ncbi:MAG: SDR family NAD(P)-dependent oxidoreductase [Gammaproteobacteria bacterium]|nr:SDR family NAD(P)-dependent oxidoreductase [Gammaproteobacteria bacterium]
MHNENLLTNLTVVVTGANGALGRAVVQLARARGAQVVGVDIGFGDTPCANGERQLCVNLGDAAATTSAFEQLGDFDVLCNLAGGFTMGEAAFDAGENWPAMFQINVETLRNATRAAIPALRRRGGGRIVNVGALSAREGQAQMSAYCAAKSTVMRLTESLSRELRDEGINVNAVLPSILDTPRNRADMPTADHARWVSTEALAEVICFLASGAARAIHGALIPVVGRC